MQVERFDVGKFGVGSWRQVSISLWDALAAKVVGAGEGLEESLQMILHLL